MASNLPAPDPLNGWKPPPPATSHRPWPTGKPSYELLKGILSPNQPEKGKEGEQPVPSWPELLESRKFLQPLLKECLDAEGLGRWMADPITHELTGPVNRVSASPDKVVEDLLVRLELDSEYNGGFAIKSAMGKDIKNNKIALVCLHAGKYKKGKGKIQAADANNAGGLEAVSAEAATRARQGTTHCLDCKWRLELTLVFNDTVFVHVRKRGCG